MSNIQEIPSQKSRIIYFCLVIFTIVLGFIQMHRNFIDYEIYEGAARKILSRDLQIFYEVDRVTPQGNYYPYFWAFLFIPFVLWGKLCVSLLGPEWGVYWGRLPFMLLFATSYFYLLNFSWRNLGLKQLDQKREYLFKIFLILPTLFLINDAFMNSNIGVLLAALLVLAFEKRNLSIGKMKLASWISSALLAAATVIKIYPALLWGFYFWERRWRLLVGAAFFSLIFYFGVPMMVEGWGKTLQLSHDHRLAVSRYDQQMGWAFDNPVFQNLPGTMMRYASVFGMSQLFAYRLSIFLPLLLTGFFLWPSFVRKKIPTERNLRPREMILPEQTFSLFMALIPFLTPVSWFNMALFYLPLMAWVLKRAMFERHRRSQFFFAAFILFYCLTTRDLVGVELCRTLQFYSAPFFGLLCLVISFIWDLFQGPAPLGSNSDFRNEKNL